MINTYLYNSQRSAQTRDSLLNLSEPKLVWKVKITSNPSYGIETMCVKDKENNLYVGCHNGALYSISYKGEIRFSFKTEKKLFSTPVVVNDECIFASGDGVLHSVDINGNLKWSLQLSNAPFLKPKVNYLNVLLRKVGLKQKAPKFSVGTIRNWSSISVNNNKIYVNVAGAGICIVSMDGKLIKKIKNKYNYPLAGGSFFTDGSFVYPDEKQFLYKRDKNYNKQWVLNIGNYNIWSNPTIDNQNNYTYFAATNGKKSIVSCVDEIGKTKWVKKINSEVRGSISISSKGYVLVPVFNGDLMALDKIEGDTVFNKNIHQGDRVLWTTPTIDKNCNILIAVRESRYTGSIRCLDPDGNELWSIKTGKTLSPPYLDENGRIFFGDWDGYYYCYQS